MVEKYDFDEDDKMGESYYQANGVSDNLRTCGRVDSVSNDMHLINELPYPDQMTKVVFSQMRNLKQELMSCQLFIIFHKGQT